MYYIVVVRGFHNQILVSIGWLVNYFRHVLANSGDVDIIPNNRGWVIPQMMIKKLAESKYRNHPLVRRIEYTPSRQSRLYQKYELLNGHQRSLTHAITQDISLLDKSVFNNGTLTSKHQVLDTLLDYYQFIKNTPTLTIDEADESYRHVLARRYAPPR